MSVHQAIKISIIRGLLAGDFGVFYFSPLYDWRLFVVWYMLLQVLMFEPVFSEPFNVLNY